MITFEIYIKDTLFGSAELKGFSKILFFVHDSRTFGSEFFNVKLSKFSVLRATLIIITLVLLTFFFFYKAIETYLFSASSLELLIRVVLMTAIDL